MKKTTTKNKTKKCPHCKLRFRLRVFLEENKGYCSRSCMWANEPETDEYYTVDFSKRPVEVRTVKKKDKK